MDKNRKIRNVLNKMRYAREDYAKRSRADIIENLKPGEPIPAAGPIYGTKYLAAYRDEVAQYKAEVHEIVEDAAAELRKKSVTPPSGDAANAIALFGLCEKVTEQEVADMMAAYGNNPMCYRTIRDVAMKSGIYTYGNSDPVALQLAAMERCEHTINNLMDKQMLATAPEPISEGQIRFIESMSVADAFPEG